MAGMLIVSILAKMKRRYNNRFIPNFDFHRLLRHGGDVIVQLWVNRPSYVVGSLRYVHGHNLLDIIYSMSKDVIDRINSPLDYIIISPGKFKYS